MDVITLLKSQKNEILNLIKEAGLDPFNFKWSVVPSSATNELRVSQVHYVDSPFFYQFDIYNGEHYPSYSPGEVMIRTESYSGSWEHQKKHVRYWLSYLSRDVGQPDLWAEISRYQLPAESELGPDVSNEPFSTYQVEQILSGLNQVRAYIEEQGLASKQQKKSVNERLDYLADAAKRQGRRDWIYTLIGVIVTITTTLALAPEQANTLWNLIRNAISGIIQFLPK